MKRPTKKIAHYSALAMGAVAILPMGCKKDAVDDPNIMVRILNDITNLVGTGDTHRGIDIDGNGTKDTYTYIYDYSGLLLSGFYNTGGTTSSVLTEALTPPIPSLGDDFIKAVPKGASISPGSATWSYIGFTQAKYAANNIGNFTGGGDKYVGIKFKIGAEVHYGWMLVNLSADGKTLTVKTVGYNIVADTGLDAGAE